MTLESIYLISDTVLNVKERVEDCIEGIVKTFNRELVNFTIPEYPCNEALINTTFIGDDLKASNIVEDIKKKFECLYYSYLEKQLNRKCGSDDSDCNAACNGMLFTPVFLAKDKYGGKLNFGTFTFDLGTFNYEIPVVLPSREDRLKSSSSSYGKFLLDSAPLKDMVAETFIIEVFNEYIGCAVSSSEANG